MKQRKKSRLACAVALAVVAHTAHAGHRTKLPNLVPYQPSSWDAPFVIETDETGNAVIKYAIKNISSTKVSKSFSVRFYVDGEKIFSHTEKKIAGKKSRKSGSFKLRGGMPEGEVTMIVDARDAITESNEDDNEATITVGSGDASASRKFHLPLPGGYSYVVSTRAGDPTDIYHQNANGKDNFYSIDFQQSGTDYPWTPIPVYSMTAGKIVQISSSKPNKYNGYFVRIDQDGDGDRNTGLVTVYLHLAYRPARANGTLLQDGDTVDVGDQLGYLGNTGESTGPHLHFTMICDGGATSSAQRECLDSVVIDGYSIQDFLVGNMYTSSMKESGR